MIRIAICDDEDVICSQIENVLLKVCGEENIPADIDVFCNGRELAGTIVSDGRYDLIFLDIQMVKGDGITAAKHIRKIDENVLFIFVSGYEKYMIELFELNVFAFIRKPIDQNKLRDLFLKANKKIGSGNLYFYYNCQRTEYKVLCKDILYFESRGRQVQLYNRQGGISVFYGKLSEVEKQLAKGKVPFLRIHQSYLVNYHWISSRARTKINLVNGESLPISDERQKEFGRSYARLLGGEIDV